MTDPTEVRLQALQQRVQALEQNHRSWKSECWNPVNPHARTCQNGPKPCELCATVMQTHTDFADELATLTQPGAQHVPALFQSGEFTLHSGAAERWKIDCDALTGRDWDTLACLIADRAGKYSAVEGVPTGGTKLAAALQAYVWQSGPLLIVDDVLTTGASMEQQRAGREAIGAVIFARGPVPSWVTPLFTLTQPGAPTCPICGRPTIDAKGRPTACGFGVCPSLTQPGAAGQGE